MKYVWLQDAEHHAQIASTAAAAAEARAAAAQAWLKAEQEQMEAQHADELQAAQKEVQQVQVRCTGMQVTQAQQLGTSSQQPACEESPQQRLHVASLWGHSVGASVTRGSTARPNPQWLSQDTAVPEVWADTAKLPSAGRTFSTGSVTANHKRKKDCTCHAG